MEENIQTFKDVGISEEIPVELLQTGIHISDKEVQEHSYLSLEELTILIYRKLKVTC